MKNTNLKLSNLNVNSTVRYTKSSYIKVALKREWHKTLKKMGSFPQ